MYLTSIYEQQQTVTAINNNEGMLSRYRSNYICFPIQYRQISAQLMASTLHYQVQYSTTSVAVVTDICWFTTSIFSACLPRAVMCVTTLKQLECGHVRCWPQQFSDETWALCCSTHISILQGTYYGPAKGSIVFEWHLLYKTGNI
jgi:hypothetical protein